jgi:hypothetical protein
MSEPMSEPTGDPTTPPPVSLPPTSTRYKLAVAAALALAVGAMYLAVTRTSEGGDDLPVEAASRPEVVEHLIPFNGAEVLRQAELGIDLAPGYEGALIVNGVEIPESDLRLVPEQNQVFFSPGEGKAIEELPGGTTCVVAIAWKSSVGRGVQDEPFRWCFEVT